MMLLGGMATLCVAATLAHADGERHAEPGPDPGEVRPNFLLIVADDLGFSDLGVMGSEIRTPNLDALAAEGLVLTDFHVSPTCSPTRAMLLTGLDTHPAGLGSMRGQASPEQAGQPAYAGVLSERVVTVAELLQDAGYLTALSGKWHLGIGPGQRPVDRGFERAYGFLGGGASHFSDQLALFFSGAPPRKAMMEDDGVPVTQLPDDWFSTTGFTDKLIEQMDSARRSARPFFALATYTAPHWPLQAPEAYLDRYAGTYDAGWDVLRAQRVDALARLGVIEVQAAPERLPFVPAWSDLDEAEQRRAARTMEVYAAMVEHLDHEIGRLVDWLETTGQRDNTWILFFADNGAEGNPVNRIVDDFEWVENAFDNRLENIGRPGSYVFTGPGWAQASASPFHLFKAFPTEGGTRTPAIFTGPGLKAGGFGDPRSEAFATVRDVTPTVLELAGVAHPGHEHAGRGVLPPTGNSLVPLLSGQADVAHDPSSVVVLELFGRRAVRQGDWKALWLYPPYGPGRWQLFDLATDPAEQVDLASVQPDQLRTLLEGFADYVARNEVILPAEDAGYAIEDPWD